MKDWTGQSVAAADDAIAGPASRVTRKDAGIEDRYVSLEGWVVCRQSIPAGQPFEDREVELVAVMVGETCLSEEERAAQITAQDQQKAAEDAAAQAQRVAEQAAREAEAARVPVLDDAARSACAVLGAGAADVATKQDRSDLARAFNAYARQSCEPKIVQDGENLTDSVGSWTGFLWDGSVAIAAEDCLKGGAAG